MRRTLTLIGLSVLAWAFLPSPAGEAQRPAQEDPVFQFSLGLGSSSCGDRWQALERYLRSSGDRLKPLRQSLSTVSQPMRARLVPVVRFLEEDTRARSRVQSWEREFTRIAGIQDGAKQSSELEGMHQRLLGIISNPKEAFGARLDAATFMAVLVTEFAPPLMATWGQDFPGLLKSQDPRVRTVGALLYARGMLFDSQSPEKGAVIPVLITGLRDVREGDVLSGRWLQGVGIRRRGLRPGKKGMALIRMGQWLQGGCGKEEEAALIRE